MLKKLRRRLVLLTMCIAALMLFVIFALVFHFTKMNLEQESLRTMEALAENPYSFGILNDDSQRVNLPYFILHIGLTGDIVATGGGYYDLSDREFLKEVLAAALQAPEQTGFLADYDLRYYRQGGLWRDTIVFVDVSGEQRTLEGLVKLSLGLGLVSLLAFFGIGCLFARLAVGPVERAWQQQRQFVADASHELKTPLTVILTNAELLQDPDYDEQQKQQFAGSILAVSRRMRELVEGLLELARADKGPERAAGERLDLSACVAESALPFEALFFEKELGLQLDIEPGIFLRGDEVKLRQLPEIFLDNALKYAEAPAQVMLSLKKQGSHALLAVSNTGEPIPPAELKNLFKRFYRRDQSRAAGSYGLGLSIAESIAHSHGGKVWAESSNGWNRFFAQLPL